MMVFSPDTIRQFVADGLIVENPDAPGSGWWVCPAAYQERERRLAAAWPLENYSLPALAFRLSNTEL